ncbi:hypothetical protein niasHT_009159 [Heterodera trifolii]|uniref:Peptidase C1A papain C-terminal domain-containing protein n=1 Tax=Heterodera trifolii TaxID=157864 RepID=A0ABD2ME98_9BILA
MEGSPMTDILEFFHFRKFLEHCGACWAFSAALVHSAAVFESRVGERDRLVLYSAQYLVDCTTRKKPSEACNGIAVMKALNRLSTDGVPLDALYPYLSGKTAIFRGDHVHEIGAQNECGVAGEVALVRTKKQGLLYKAEPAQFGFVRGLTAQMTYLTTYRLPLAALEKRYFTSSVTPKSRDSIFHAHFKTYKSKEVYDPSPEECKSAEEDPDNSMHIISIVGYGEEGGKPFWLIVNSYGQEWGDHGEAKYVRGKNACGIEQYGYFIKSVEHF